MTDVPLLASRARRLAEQGGRRLLGVAGPPGAGKSTLTAQLCTELGPLAVRVPLDGFHLSNQMLAALGLADRKGAPETFDAGGFVSLLRRLRDNTEDVVYAPDFFRELEEAIVAVLPVRRDVPLVIVEGNYLLLDEGPWSAVAAFFDELWYVDLDDAVRLDRLVRRHQQHGRSAEEAEAWTRNNDELNAAVVAKYRDRADLVVRLS
jgi:pantothenate kinase